MLESNYRIGLHKRTHVVRVVVVVVVAEVVVVVGVVLEARKEDERQPI